MNFRLRFLTSTKVLDDIASDLLEVATVRDKDEFRLKLMDRRFRSLVSSSNLVTQQDIETYSKVLRNSTLTYSQLTSIAKKLSKALNAHYKTLSVILRKWV